MNAERDDTCHHEPDDAGAACRYCGLPAEPVDPDDLADALATEIERERAQAARAGARAVLMYYASATRGLRPYAIDTTHDTTAAIYDAGEARHARYLRATRDQSLSLTRSHWPILEAARACPPCNDR